MSDRLELEKIICELESKLITARMALREIADNQDNAHINSYSIFVHRTATEALTKLYEKP